MSPTAAMAIRVGWVLLLGGSVGAVTSLGTVAFMWALDSLNDLLLWLPRIANQAQTGTWWLLVLFAVPVVGGLLVGLICRTLPNSRACGPADVVESVQTFRGRMPMAEGGRSIVASLLGLGVGASAGQYGPLVHLGATVGSAISRVTGRSAWVGSTAIACGVAAAIATAFTAPIAGVLFAHEVVLRHFSLRAFAPVTVAAIVGYIVAAPVLSHRPILDFSDVSVVNIGDYLLFVLLGVMSALVAVVFMRAMHWMGRYAERLSVQAWVRPALAGVPVGLCLIWLPEVTGIGLETMRLVLSGDHFGSTELLIMFPLKIALTVLCVGFGLATGVFTPALVIGLIFGALAGQGLDSLLGSGHSEIGIFAICGAVAVASPVIGAPLSAILIVFELTRNYELTTAAMVSIVFANMVSYRLFGHSWFDHQLNERGMDISQGRDRLVLEQHRIDELPITMPLTVQVLESVAAVAGHIEGQEQDTAWVVDDAGLLCGRVQLNSLRQLLSEGLDDRAVGDVAEDIQVLLTPDTSFARAIDQAVDSSWEWVPVVESDGHRFFLGVLSKLSIIRSYQAILSQIREEEQAAA